MNEEIMKSVSFTLVLCSPDRVNEIGREAGLSVQAIAMTDTLKNTIYLSWPPTDEEYGMTMKHLMFALGYEVVSNLLHLDTDPLGR